MADVGEEGAEVEGDAEAGFVEEGRGGREALGRVEVGREALGGGEVGREVAEVEEGREEEAG